MQRMKLLSGCGKHWATTIPLQAQGPTTARIRKTAMRAASMTKPRYGLHSLACLASTPSIVIAALVRAVICLVIPTKRGPCCFWFSSGGGLDNASERALVMLLAHDVTAELDLWLLM
jgi:hypothetical protein